MLPIDLSKLPGNWIKQILSAILPGGLLVLGLGVTHQPQMVQLLKYAELNAVAKSVLGLFVSFVLGFLMVALGASLLLFFYFLGYSVISFVRQRWDIVPEESKNMVWRRIVAYSLPRQLNAVEEPGVSSEVFKSRLEEVARKIGKKDANALTEALATAGGVEVYRAQIDQEWKYMYSVLQSYFFKQPNEDVWICGVLKPL